MLHSYAASAIPIGLCTAVVARQGLSPAQLLLRDDSCFHLSCGELRESSDQKS